jgi:hypothetical protein
MAIPSPNSENGQKGVKRKNQPIDFIGLSKRHFCQKWLKTQIGEGIVMDNEKNYRSVAALPP